MIKAQNLKPNSRSRRDERRKAKQQAYAAANPMQAGRKYQNVGEAVEVVQKPGYQPKCIKFVAMDIDWSVREFKGQILRASYLYEHEFKRPAITTGSICMPDVAKYHAGERTVRKDAVHITK